MGTDQVYDPVSLNQNKAERREQETERQSVLLSRPALLFTVTTSARLFLDVLYGAENVCFRVLEDLQLRTLPGTILHNVRANELV